MNGEENMKPKKDKNEGMTAGMILIAVGFIFLLMQFSNFSINNWWALFILIPVVFAWNHAIRSSIEAGQFTNEAAQALAGSLFPLFVAVIFLLNWDWGRVWPGFIILVGINALVNTWRGNHE